MFLILIVVISLVAWALHLMQQAVSHREFSLMLAGFLVSAAAAATMTVYFLMGNCVGYLTHAAQQSYRAAPASNAEQWILPMTAEAQWSATWADATDRPIERL